MFTHTIRHRPVLTETDIEIFSAKKRQHSKLT